MKEKLQEYITKNYLPDIKVRSKKSNIITNDLDNKKLSKAYNTNEYQTSKIDNFINKSITNTSFQELLFKYIDERNLKDSDVYNKVHIDRRLFSKIRSNNQYHPSKDTIILLGLSLKLNEKEIEELLNSASYSLPKNNIYDLIIRFCFVEEIYDIKEINELLATYNCKLFSY